MEWTKKIREGEEIMKLKKVLVVLLAASLSIPPVGMLQMQRVQAQERELAYEMTEDGWYYMETPTGVSIMGYHQDVEELVIPAVLEVDGKEEEVTAIEEEAFAESVNLKHITIPGTVEYLYRGAFRSCEALETVTYLEPELGQRDALHIMEEVFENCISLTEANIPSDIYEIGDEAFSGCFQITEVVIPKSVARNYALQVGTYVFANCSSLKKATIECHMTDMPKGLFYGCTELEEVHLPDTMKNIGERAFYCCTSLTDLQLPAGIRAIGTNAYEGCTGLKILVFPNSLDAIGEQAFKGCTGFDYVQMSENLTYIQSNAFEGCTGITELVLPEGFTNISTEAFRGCTALKDVYLPNTVTDIYENAFVDCNENLTIHTTEDANVVINYAKYEQDEEIPLSYDYYDKYEAAEDCVWGDWKYYLVENGNAAICGYTGERGSTIEGIELEIPSVVGEENIPVTAIGSYAFMDSEGISKITIPSSVKEIGVSAFNTCMGLYDVIIPDSVETIHGTAFTGSVWTTIHADAESAAIAYAQEYGFQYNIPVKSIFFVSDVMEMEKGDFKELEVRVFPEAATNRELVWSSSDENIVSVSYGGYAEALNVGTATITATAEDGSGVYGQCVITVVEPQGEEIPPETDEPGSETPPADDNNQGTVTPPTGDNNQGTVTPPADNNQGTTKPPVTNTGKEENVSKPKNELKAGTKRQDDKKTGVYVITKTKSKGAEVAFAGVAKKTATSVTIPKTVKIKGVTYKVTSIRDQAFKNNKKIKKVTIGTNITKIGKNAFLNCKNLKTIDIKSKKLKSVGKAAWKGIYSKAVIKVPKSKKNAYKVLLKNKGQGKKVKIK